MSESLLLGHNYNIQCMKLLHELKALYPNVPDETVKACMKKLNNHRERCKEDLRRQSEIGYRSRHRLKFSQRRFSAGTVHCEPGQYGEDGGGGKRAGGRRNSLCAGWTNVLSPLDQNRTERRNGCCSNFAVPTCTAAAAQTISVGSTCTSVLQNSSNKRFCEFSNTLPRKTMRWERNNNSGSDGVEKTTAQNRPDDNKLVNTRTTILHPTELQHSSSTSSDPTTSSSGYNSYGRTRTESIQNKDETDSTNLVTSIFGDITSHDYNISNGNKDSYRPSNGRPSVDIHPNSGPLNIRDEENNYRRRRKLKTPKLPLSLNQLADLETIPTVVLTPESPPKDSSNMSRQVETLYSPDQDTLHSFIKEGVPDILNISPDLLVYGNQTTLTKTSIDLVPGLDSISLPFGSSRIDDSSNSESCTATTSTSSVSTGTLHFLTRLDQEKLAVATTSFCSIQRTISSTSLPSTPASSSASDPDGRPKTKSTTVIYTVNSKPVICENPFRKVFAKRKQFYQSRERRSSLSPETSSKRLLWRPCNHVCRRNSLCPDNNKKAREPRYFTLNANIQPFNAFSIRHGLTDKGCEESSANLTLEDKTGEDGHGVELLPDGEGIRYQSRVEMPEEGTQAHLEVKVQRDGSTITTRRTGSTDCTSNEICVQLLDGGNRVNIQQSQSCLPVPEVAKSVRPTSLHIPGPKYATARPQSLYQGRGTSPLSVPRYNSLPNLKGVGPEGVTGGYGYQTHPRDEEKRIAYTRALLSHQMEQLFKLESSLRAEKGEVDQLRHEVRDLEESFSRRQLKNPAIAVEKEVQELTSHITNLRGECEMMSEKVTHLTAGKVPLGETSINFQHYLKDESTTVPEPNDAIDGRLTEGRQPVGGSSSVHMRPEEEGEVGKWDCTECTFANHPSLDTCEICDMPRINIGSPPTAPGCSVHQTNNCSQEMDTDKSFVRAPRGCKSKMFSSAKNRPAGPSPAARTQHKDQSGKPHGVLDPLVQTSLIQEAKLTSPKRQQIIPTKDVTNQSHNHNNNQQTSQTINNPTNQPTN